MREITKTAGGHGPHAIEAGVEPVYVALAGQRWGEAWLDPGDVVPTDGLSAASVAVTIQSGLIQQVIVPNGYELRKVKA